MRTGAKREGQKQDAQDGEDQAQCYGHAVNIRHQTAGQQHQEPQGMSKRLYALSRVEYRAMPGQAVGDMAEGDEGILGYPHAAEYESDSHGGQQDGQRQVSVGREKKTWPGMRSGPGMGDQLQPR